MKIDEKLNKNFQTTLNKLIDQYGEDFEWLNGLHEKQLNHSTFIENFTKDNLVEVTTDPSANSSRKDICSLMAEKGKSHDKLLAFNKIFIEFQKKFGIKRARQWAEDEWNGALYLNNFSSASYKPYCFSYSLDRLAEKGLFFLDNYNNEPPQHLDTFNSDVVEFVSWTSNRTSGQHMGRYITFPFHQWG